MSKSSDIASLYGKALGAGLIGLAALAADGLLTAPAYAGEIPKGWDLGKNKKAFGPELYSGATGVYVATGDVNGDGAADIIAGNGPGVDNTFIYMKYGGSDFAITKSTNIDTPDTHQVGIRMAAADLDGDGVPNPIYGDASGSNSRVSFPFGKIIVKYQTEAYAYPQTKGVYIAAGDVDGDGRADLVTGPTVGGNTGGLPPESAVKIFAVDQITGGISLSSSFTPYSAFTGGVRVAKGDVNGDGIDEIITAPDQGSSPEVRVYSYDKGSPLLLWNLASSVVVDAAASTGGVWVAAGDVTGDGKADIVTGADAGGLPQVKVYSYDAPTSSWGIVYDFLAYDASFTGGVTVAVGDFNNDGFGDVITAPATAVPEPGSMALLTSGAAALLGRRRRRPPN